ncbi:MAG: hypothetical protein ACLGI7_15420, partial [Gammaproteobacteria bacterium]
MRDALGDERGAVLVGCDDVAELRGGKRALQRPQRGIVAAAARADDVRDAFGLEVGMISSAPLMSMMGSWVWNPLTQDRRFMKR